MPVEAIYGALALVAVVAAIGWRIEVIRRCDREREVRRYQLRKLAEQAFPIPVRDNAAIEQAVSARSLMRELIDSLA